MKKTGVLIVAFITLLLFSSCGTSDYNWIMYNDGLPDYRIIEEGPNYKIVEINDDGKKQYRYYLYDSNNNEAYRGFSFYEPPEIEYYNDRVIQIFEEPTEDRRFYMFYDTIENIVGESIESPALIQDGLAVYMVNHEVVKLVVQDIVDKNKFYKEFDCGFTPQSNPDKSLLEAILIGDNLLKIKYLTGYNRIEKNALLFLDEVENEQQANEIAVKYVKAAYTEKFDDYIFDTDLKDGVWTVRYTNSRKNSQFECGIPVVNIKASNGRVLSSRLEK